jgi:hypothetical protein
MWRGNATQIVAHGQTDVKILGFFLIRIVGGGVQMVKLGTSATSRPTVPAPSDYEGGEFGGGNRTTRREPAPVPLCPPQIPHDLTGPEPWSPRWEASE